MPGLTVKILLQDIKKLETEALIVGFYENIRPLKGLAGELDWLLCGALSRLILDNKVRGSLGDLALLSSRGKVPAKKIFMVGLGPRENFSPAIQRRAAEAAVTSVLGAGVRSAAIEYFNLPGLPAEAGLSDFRRGLTDGAGGRQLDLALLAADAATYETMSRRMNG
jgi:hypothetical protein